MLSSTIFQIKLYIEGAMILLRRIRHGSFALRLGKKTFLLKKALEMQHGALLSCISSIYLTWKTAIYKR
jgi:hypothetical protein